MANVFDYLSWRGDLTLAQSPFNEVDGLILCELVYADLSGFVPAQGSRLSVRVGDAAEGFFDGRENSVIRLGVLIPDNITPLFKRLGECARFRDMLLLDYVDRVDGKREEQFSALTIDLTDGTYFTAFRGTDDTLVGWKENFNMSYLASVPAQEDAAKYATACFERFGAPLRVGGHSKGGNLAVYAAMKVPERVQNSIVDVYNFDGPGFRQSIMEQDDYQRVRAKVKTILPQTSLVGMLMEHEDKYEVVKSTAVGPYQHDGFSWTVEGPGFVHLDSVTDNCKYVDRTLHAWIASVDEEERKHFIDTMFDLLFATGATTLTELTSAKIKNTRTLLEGMFQLDKKTKQMMRKMLALLIKAGAPESSRPRAQKDDPPSENNRLDAMIAAVKKNIKMGDENWLDALMTMIKKDAPSDPEDTEARDSDK